MQGTQKLLKVAKLMVEASFTHKRRETELKTDALKVEQEQAKAQARVKVLDKENKVDQSKAVISSGTEREIERERERESCIKIYHQMIQKSTMVSKTATLFKNLFITKKSLSREIILLGVPAMLEIILL